MLKFTIESERLQDIISLYYMKEFDIFHGTIDRETIPHYETASNMLNKIRQSSEKEFNILSFNRLESAILFESLTNAMQDCLEWYKRDNDSIHLDDILYYISVIETMKKSEKIVC